MKTVLSITLGVLFIFSASSCKKCVECEAKDGPTNLSAVKQEYCGSSKERNDFEDSFMTTYTAAGFRDVSCK